MSGIKKWLVPPLIFLGAWAGVRYLLPVLLPFFLGGGLALAAEPLVSFAKRRLRLPQALASGLGVTLTLGLMGGILSLLGAFAVKELGALAESLPDLQQTADQGMKLMGDWLVSMTERTPEGVRPLLTKTALELSQSGTEMVSQVTKQVPGVLTGVVEKIPGSAIGVGTGLIAGYMISSRLPSLRSRIGEHLPESWNTRYLPAIRRVKEALGGWLKAQLKLMAVTWVIVSAGFMLLKVPFGPAWAVLVAVIDAVPMLGTGLALLPCGLVALLRGNGLRALGFTAIWAAAAGTRALLEPRLVGRHLGLDPLLTLGALYAGYRFWGVWGMILAPILAAAASAVTEKPASS